MHKPYGSIMVRLGEDVLSGLRVAPVQADPGDGFPIVRATYADKTKAWLGIALVSGKEGDLIPVMPPYSGTVMVRLECHEAPVRTGYWANTEADGWWSCHAGTGEIGTGLIITPELNEEVAPGKTVKAMIFTGRFCYDGGPYIE